MKSSNNVLDKEKVNDGVSPETGYPQESELAFGEVSCPICGSKEVRRIRRNRIFDTYLFTCSSCDLFFSSPEANGQLIANYYGKSQDEMESRKYKLFMKKVNSEVSLWDSNRRHSQLANMIDNEIGKNKKILEIGCGNAYTLIYLSSKGHSCVGVEPGFDQWDAIKNKDIKIHQCVFGDVKFNEKFDIVLLEHLLEHIPNPIDFLFQINSIMTENGLLFIEVPNSRNYYHIKGIPTDDEHFFYYSSKNLANLLNKCKFTNIKTDTYDCGDIQLDWIINKLLLNRRHKIYTGHHSIKISNKFIRRWMVTITERFFKYLYIKIIKESHPFYIQNETDEGLWILSFSQKGKG